MKMIQQCDKAHKIATAQQITYENVRFYKGSRFIEMMNELARNQLVSDIWSRKDNVWDDYRHRNGIMLETSINPLVLGSAEWLKVSGSHQSLLEFNSIIERYAEYDGKPEPEEIELSHQYHDELPPELWNEEGEGYTLDDTVREYLIKNAEAFYEFLKLEDLEVDDIIMTGSTANYNWTEHSDIDLHLIIDMTEAEAAYGTLTREYFDAKKRLWNEFHNVEIRGFPVEFYIEDSEEEHVSTGVYSIIENDWIITPSHEEPSVDDRAVKAKTATFIGEIQDVIQSNKADAIEKMVEKLRKMRQSGLSKSGEFSTNNLVFKVLRNNGWLEKLYDCRSKAYDRELSVEDEEWAHYR